MRYDGTGAQKVSSWTAFYRMRFHEGWSVVVDCASLRPTAWMFDGASRIAWKYRRVVPPSFSLSLSLSLSLSPLSLRPILPAITSLVDQIKGPGGATVGPGEWMKWLTGCRVGDAQGRDSFSTGVALPTGVSNPLLSRSLKSMRI